MRRRHAFGHPGRSRSQARPSVFGNHEGTSWGSIGGSRAQGRLPTSEGWSPAPGHECGLSSLRRDILSRMAKASGSGPQAPGTASPVASLAPAVPGWETGHDTALPARRSRVGPRRVGAKEVGTRPSVHLGKARNEAEDDLLDARLASGGHRDGVAVAAHALRNPENVDFRLFGGISSMGLVGISSPAFAMIWAGSSTCATGWCTRVSEAQRASGSTEGRRLAPWANRRAAVASSAVRAAAAPTATRGPLARSPRPRPADWSAPLAARNPSSLMVARGSCIRLQSSGIPRTRTRAPTPY
jgi:hypothetical protein